MSSHAIEAIQIPLDDTSRKAVADIEAFANRHGDSINWTAYNSTRQGEDDRIQQLKRKTKGERLEMQMVTWPLEESLSAVELQGYFSTILRFNDHYEGYLYSPKGFGFPAHLFPLDGPMVIGGIHAEEGATTRFLVKEKPLVKVDENMRIFGMWKMIGPSKSQ